MATYRYIVKDLSKSLNQNFDDADITDVQILYWVTVIANRLRVQQVALTESGLYTSTFSSLAVQKDNKGRYYFELPTAIMDLPNEQGIEYITYNEETGCCCEGATFAQRFFQPTNVMKLHRLYKDEYEKPSPSNPYFYRVGHKIDGEQVNRVYLAGVECITLRDVEVALKCTLDPKDICDLDDTIPLPDELVETLIKEVLALGRFVMMIPEELENDGTDETTDEMQASIPRAPRAVQQPQQTTE